MWFGVNGPLQECGNVEENIKRTFGESNINNVL